MYAKATVVPSLFNLKSKIFIIPTGSTTTWDFPSFTLIPAGVEAVLFQSLELKRKSTRNQTSPAQLIYSGAIAVLRQWCQTLVLLTPRLEVFVSTGRWVKKCSNYGKFRFVVLILFFSLLCIHKNLFLFSMPDYLGSPLSFEGIASPQLRTQSQSLHAWTSGTFLLNIVSYNLKQTFSVWLTFLHHCGGTFAQFSFQRWFSSLRFLDICLCSAASRSHHGISVRLRSGLRLGHYNTLTQMAKL